MPFLPLLQAQLQSNTYPSPSSSQLLLFSSSITLGPSKPFWRGNRLCRRLGTVCRGFSLLLLTSYCFPALAWVATGLQSLQRCLCPSTGHPKDASQSTEHLLPGCISIHVPNNVCFHTSPSFLLLFLQTLVFTYILMCPLLSVLPCLLSCISLHLLSPAAATLPQTCLKRSAVCSPVWLKFWCVMDCFPPFRDTWNLLWPAQNSS